MSKFKIGDRVVVKHWQGDNAYFEGAEGFVTGYEKFVVVRFDHALCDLLVDELELELVSAKPDLTKAQAAGVEGGSQEHSVGEYYPLAAVMYEHNGNRCIAIEDLQTGEVASIAGQVTNWRTFDNAYDHIELIARGNGWFKRKGRVMNIDGKWVVAEPANPVRVARLRNMLHRG